MNELIKKVITIFVIIYVLVFYSINEFFKKKFTNLNVN